MSSVPLGRVSGDLPPPPPAVGSNSQPDVKEKAASNANVIAVDAPYEDYTILKILACVPIIGEVMSIVTGFTLTKKNNQAHEEKDPLKLARLLKISKDHAICSVVRRLLTLAALITLVAVGIFTLGLAPTIIFGVVLLAMTGASAYHIYQSKKHVEDLELNKEKSEYWLSLAKPIVK